MKEQAMDIFRMTDQPEECRKCGWRTETIKTISDTEFIEKCPGCGYIYRLIDDGE